MDEMVKRKPWPEYDEFMKHLFKRFRQVHPYAGQTLKRDPHPRCAETNRSLSKCRVAARAGTGNCPSCPFTVASEEQFLRGDGGKPRGLMSLGAQGVK